MGQIGERFLKRMSRNRRLTAQLHQAATSIGHALGSLKRDMTKVRPNGEVQDPLHNVYIAVQNQTSVFAEQVSGYPEFEPYYDLVVRAEDEYMPGGPPMSPLTRSYFTTWAFFDVRFGPDQETIGTCLLQAGEKLGFDPRVLEAIRGSSESRMGIYELGGSGSGRWKLKELITDDELEAVVPCGYRGQKGQLWYVRVLPPLPPVDHHLVLTTPYVLLTFGKNEWISYLSKSLVGLTVPERRQRLRERLKYGREPNEWNEFIFQAYANHQFDAIFLTGIPDVPASLPHAPKS